MFASEYGRALARYNRMLLHMALMLVFLASAQSSIPPKAARTQAWQITRPWACRSIYPPNVSQPRCPGITTVGALLLWVSSIQEINDVHSYIKLTMSQKYIWKDPLAQAHLETNGNLDGIYKPQFVSPYAFGKTERVASFLTYQPTLIRIGGEQTAIDMVSSVSDTMQISFKTAEQSTYSSYVEPPPAWDSSWFPLDQREIMITLVSDGHVFLDGVDMKWVTIPKTNTDAMKESTVTKEQVQKLVGGGWIATSELTWEFRQSMFGPIIVCRFSLTRNMGSWMSSVVIPLLAFVMLAIFSLFLPAAGPMAMPRVALTLLAMVSVASMTRTVIDATPMGVTSFLGSFMLSCVLSIVATTGVHVIVLSKLNGDNELLQRCNWWLRTCTLATSTFLIGFFPPVVIWSGMGWKGQFPISVIVFTLEILVALKMSLIPQKPVPEEEQSTSNMKSADVAMVGVTMGPTPELEESREESPLNVK